MSSHMSPAEQRITIIGVMWFAIGLIGIAMAVAGSGTLAIFGLVLIALLSTFILMREPGARSRDKRKRQAPADQVALLMDLLDEHERAEFKAMLKQRVLDQFEEGARDGELPAEADSLAALLDARARDRARSE